MAEDTSYQDFLKKLFDPTKKMYDPFGEYRGHDDEPVAPPAPAHDSIDRFVQQYGYFNHSNYVEIYNPATGTREPFIKPPQPPCPEEESPLPQPPSETTNKQRHFFLVTP